MYFFFFLKKSLLIKLHLNLSWKKQLRDIQAAEYESGVTPQAVKANYISRSNYLLNKINLMICS